MKVENNIVYRLSLLWAFAEGGLGGIMHLLHIPMTGFIVGAISVIINVFIAAYSKINSRLMLSSLGLVLLCKFALSPHSPLGAYIAVSFQGILAILIFKLIGLNRISIFTYATVVMLENSIQKPIMGYLIFGDELAQGIVITINKFFKNIESTQNFLATLIGIYFSIYAVWGIVIGNWAYQFLQSIENFKLENKGVHFTQRGINERMKDHRKIISSIILFSLIFFFLFFYFSAAKVHWSVYLLKAITWFVLLAFILPYFLRLILKFYSKKEESTIQQSLIFMPKIKENFLLSFDLLKDKKGIAKVREFIFYIIYLNVFYSIDES